MADDMQEVLFHPLIPEDPLANNVEDEVQNIIPPIQHLEEPEQNGQQEEVAENQPDELAVPIQQGQQQNFLHLEIPEDELMNEQEMHEIQNEEEDAQMEWQGNGQVVVNNIHLGMVRIYPSFTPNISQLVKQPATASPSLNHPSVSLPKGWSAFFKVMLDSPPHYDWARKLLLHTS